MPETASKPSAGAREIAKTFLGDSQHVYLYGLNGWINEEEMALLIDAALVNLLQAAKRHAHYDSTDCALARALAPWEPESGGGR